MWQGMEELAVNLGMEELIVDELWQGTEVGRRPSGCRGWTSSSSGSSPSIRRDERMKELELS
jgi:hypothetical protein